MPRYGEAQVGNPILAEFQAEKDGIYDFKLYPQLWGSLELERFYRGRNWTIHQFLDPGPDLEPISGIYMFVVSPECGGIRDHSYIFYVGQTTNQRVRYKHYLNEKKGNVANPRRALVMLLNYFEGYIYFHFTPVPAADLDRAEKILKDNITPVSNTQLEIIGRLAKVNLE